MFIIILLFGHFTSCLAMCDQEIYRISGSLNIIGLFDLHKGENCTIPDFGQRQNAQNMIDSVKAIRLINVIQNVEIGLTIFDTCQQTETSLDPVCLDSFKSGLVIIGGFSNKEVDVGIPVKVLKNEYPRIFSSIVAKVLFDLGWSPIHHLIVEDPEIKESLVSEFSSRHLCILHFSTFRQITGKLNSSRNLVIVGQIKNIEKISNFLPESQILVVPTDREYNKISGLKGRVLILVPTQVETSSLSDGTENSTEEYDPSELVSSVSSLSQLQIVMELMQMIKTSRALVEAACGKTSLCSSIPDILDSTKFPSNQLKNINDAYYQLKVLDVDVKKFESAVLLQQTPENILKIGAVKISGSDWSLDSDFTSEVEILTCDGTNCSHCYNYETVYKNEIYLRPLVGLRNEAWVAALLSVSAVGVISCLAIAIFILVRICKKDLLEGNPGFSFLMLTSLIFMYSGILPFSVQPINDSEYFKGVLCGFKVIGTSLSYSIVYSVMLARSLMLASCDDDGGFMSHVNGYLQTILCFFILGVQIALTLQFWAMSWFFTDQSLCQVMSEGHLFLYLLGYDMFLLALLVGVSPFIVKSKRNYSEGGYFAAASFVCLLVWISWCCGYILIPEYSDIFICLGLVMTATVILVVVFIPRTYLMLTGIVRDHIVSTLPTLSHAQNASVVDVNYRSTQALYDSVSTRGQVNPNYYTERPTTPSTSKMEDINEPNVYERYDHSPSPNVTRF